MSKIKFIKIIPVSKNSKNLLNFQEKVITKIILKVKVTIIIIIIIISNIIIIRRKKYSQVNKNQKNKKWKEKMNQMNKPIWK